MNTGSSFKARAFQNLWVFGSVARMMAVLLVLMTPATLSVLDTFHFWRERYACPFGTQVTKKHDRSVARDVYRSTVCRDGSVLRTDVMRGTGHVWPSFAPALIADFFGL